MQVDVELLVVPDCANEAATLRMVRAVLDELGLDDVRVRTTVIDNELEARRREFVGSPTVLVNGADPFAVPGLLPGLACRVYITGSRLSGVPDRDLLREAITAAMDST